MFPPHTRWTGPRLGPGVTGHRSAPDPLMTVTFDRIVSGVEAGTGDDLLLLQNLGINRPQKDNHRRGKGKRNARAAKNRNSETLTGVYWITVASCFPAAICFPLGLQQTAQCKGKRQISLISRQKHDTQFGSSFKQNVIFSDWFAQMFPSFFFFCRLIVEKL